MKKVLFTAAALFAFGFANAQEDETPAFGFSKGNIFVEGNLGFSSSTQTDSDITGDLTEMKSNSFNFNPKAGYFVADKLAVGVELMLGSDKDENTTFGTPNSITEDKMNSFGAGVFARYYFLELGKRFKTYAEAGVGFGSGKYEQTQTGSVLPLTQDQKMTNVNVGLDLGMQYFVTSKMAINFGLSDVLGFSTGKYEDNLNNSETSFSEFNGNLNVFNNFFSTARFGVTYKF